MNELVKYLEENFYSSEYDSNLLEIKCENNQIGNKIIEWFEQVFNNGISYNNLMKLNITGVYGLLPIRCNYEQRIVEFSVDYIEEPHGLKNVEVTTQEFQDTIYRKNTLFNRLFRKYPKYSPYIFPYRSILKFITINKKDPK